MKKFSLYISLFTAGILLFSACQKETKTKADFTTTEGNAFIRVVHVAPSFRQVFNAPDSFNIYVNGAKVNSPFLTYLSIFPSPFNAYFAVQPGLQQIKVSVHGFASANPDSTLITSFTKLFTTGQYYTLLVTDSIKSPRDSSQMFLPDVYSKPSPGNYSLRFVHAVWNDTTGKNIDIFSARRNANIYNNIKPGQILPFITLPYNTQLNDTLYVRRAGTLFNLSILNNIGLSNQRVYTLVYRGNGDLTTTNKARSLGAYLHQ